MVRPREGDWFAVPLAPDAYAVGLVARAPKRGHTLFGYFFGPFRPQPPAPEELGALTARDSVFLARFYDEGLVSGRWPVRASSEALRREDWPMPEFTRALMREFTGESSVIRYSEENPDKPESRRSITLEEEANYPPDDGVFPDEHVEHELRELFGIPHEYEQDKAGEISVEEGVRHILLIPRDAVDGVCRELRDLGFGDASMLDEREGGLTDLEVFQRGSVSVLQSTIEDVESQLTDLAQRAGGEYDGLEWAVPRDARGGHGGA